MNSPAEDIPYSNSLKSHWDSIERSRSAMAKHIGALAGTLSGPRRRQLRSVAQWLKSSRGYDAVLERPDVLCFCTAWLDAFLAKPNEIPLTESELIAAIGKGYCKFESSAPSPRNLTPFLYPALALLAWLLMVVFGSIFILPEFRAMYEEFGVELPRASQGVLEMGIWFERNWRWILVVLVLLPIVLLISSRISQWGRAYSLSWFDRRFCKFRIQVSVWANHVASLLAAGVGDNEAIQVAGRCSDSSRLKVGSKDFLRGAQKYLVDPIEYPLINNSLSLKNRGAKIAILEETGRYYRAVGQVVQGWWLAWLSKAILFNIYATVGFVLWSLYKPLISIISGLI